jgi:hypothetical protein
MMTKMNISLIKSCPSCRNIGPSSNNVPSIYLTTTRVGYIQGMIGENSKRQKKVGVNEYGYLGKKTTFHPDLILI